MIPLPNQLSVFVNKLNRIVAPWNSYLQQFTQAPPPIMSIIVSASPFSYVAKEPGNIAITGGTLTGTGVVLTRGSTSITLGTVTNRMFPVAIDDIIRVTYSVLPTLRFIPAYGQNTAV